MTKSSLLLQALIEQIPEMGEFYISEDDNIKEVLWFMFHIRLKYNIKIPNGHIIYRYKIDDFPMSEYDAKLTNEEGDIIYLYFMDE